MLHTAQPKQESAGGTRGSQHRNNHGMQRQRGRAEDKFVAPQCEQGRSGAGRASPVDGARPDKRAAAVQHPDGRALLDYLHRIPPPTLDKEARVWNACPISSALLVQLREHHESKTGASVRKTRPVVGIAEARFTMQRVRRPERRLARSRMPLSLSTSAWVTGRGSHTMAAYSFCNERKTSGQLRGQIGFAFGAARIYADIISRPAEQNQTLCPNRYYLRSVDETVSYSGATNFD